MGICKCGNYTEGTTDKCASCNRADRKAEAARAKVAKVYRLQRKPIKAKAFKLINPVSKKQAKRLRIYKPIRDKFLSDNPICQCCNNRPSDQVHHKAGRVGDLLFDIRYFLAACDPCHKKIEAEPGWAKAHGYSVDRISK